MEESSVGPSKFSSKKTAAWAGAIELTTNNPPTTKVAIQIFMRHLSIG